MRRHRALADRPEVAGPIVAGDGVERDWAIDGRRRRSINTRQKLIQAYLHFVKERKERPTVLEIAQRAGCSRRSLFQRFESVNLLAAAAFDQATQGSRTTPGSEAVEADRQTRIGIQAELRARICEELWPLWDVVRQSQDEAPALRTRIEELREFARVQLEELYRPELDALSLTTRTGVVIALEAVMDFECWRRIREVHGLNPEEGRQVLREIMDRLLPR
jgi:AcrR family transcriptional regulator